MTKSFVAFRIAASLTALSILAQAISAGMLLSFPGGRSIHAGLGFAVLLTTLASLLTAILVWRPGGGGSSYIGGSAALFVLSIAQLGLGMAGVALVHVPLGVLLWGGALMLVRSAWQRPAGSARSSSAMPATAG